jgi:hypothetical protein
MMALTLGHLDHSSILHTKNKVTKIVNEIYDELLKDFKEKWDTPKEGRRKKWPSDWSPTYFLEVYNKARRDLKKIKEIYNEPVKRSVDDRLDRIAQKYPDVPMRIVRGLEFEAPFSYARELAALRLGVEDGPYLDRKRSEARREAKSKSKK